MCDFVSLEDRLISIDQIQTVDLSRFQTETILVILKDGEVEEVSGFDALNLVWKIQPSWLEGNNTVKWKKNAWAVHNLIAHPVMQILAWFKLYKQAMWVHDVTVPKPIGYKNVNND